MNGVVMLYHDGSCFVSHYILLYNPQVASTKMLAAQKMMVCVMPHPDKYHKYFTSLIFVLSKFCHVNDIVL